VICNILLPELMRRYVDIGAVFVECTIVLVHTFQGCSCYELLIQCVVILFVIYFPE
jgi:hypothetical protein